MTLKKYGTILVRSLFFGLVLSFALTVPSEGQEETEDAYARGLTLFLDENYSEALDYFSRAAAKATEDPRPYFFAGVCQARLGDSEKARSFYRRAAAREYLPGGRQIDVPLALRRIQGTDRQEIETARQAVAALWEKKMRERNALRYGDKVQQQENLLTREYAADKEEDQADEKTVAKAAQPAAKSDLPSVASITPLSREERPVVEMNKIYDTKVDDFQFFRDDIGKTVLSSAEQRRLQERKTKVTYTDPMERPAADGSKFINILDPMESVADGKPYFGEDDPDDLYGDAESSPLVTGCALFKGLSFGNEKKNDAQMGGNWGGADPMMSGMDPMGAGAIKKVTGDDTNMFNFGAAANPFEGGAAARSGKLDPFKTDRDFKPPVKPNPNLMGSSDGMSMPPSMSPAP